MSGTLYTLEIQPNIPVRLARLQDLANDLLYTWDRQVRGLFFWLDRNLWEECGHNPKVFLRRVSQKRLEEAAEDRFFMESYTRALSVYDAYQRARMNPDLEEYLNPKTDLVAYFCAEFGFHESIPLYSGGLGILAGDHCKAASDLAIPFVGVGMLYRQGYFTQIIDGSGRQVAHYTPSHFDDLPVVPATDASNREVHVQVELPGRRLSLKVWQAHAGHIRLYLLDSDLEENTPADRTITHQLYGGDRHTRVQQEIVLGIGGVRALRALGLTPTVWHINEGHSAFQVLERCRELTEAGMDFDTALELVAGGTVFTTHTPVPAGHDYFSHDLLRPYMEAYVQPLGISMDQFLDLGNANGYDGNFNMTALALRGSRFHNGVSRIHGGVASRMEGYAWPQIPAAENPMGCVTNGVHVPTFLAREWANVFDMHFGGDWREELLNEEYWRRIDSIPDHNFWSQRQSLKSLLLEEVRKNVSHRNRRNGSSEAHIERLVRALSPDNTDVLILGFARRFATYKRAMLLFNDPKRLARLLNDPERPVLLFFGGKAHPLDQPGQDLIRAVHNMTLRPEFEGKVFLLEDFNLALARKLVTGVDVWLNTPEYPLEASGTSGQKAGINGVLNLSVLDGWWGEGHNGGNGWAITPHGPDFPAEYRDREEAQELLDLLEYQVIPTYYERSSQGYPEKWVQLSKASMRSLIPRFNAQRMVTDYVRSYYGPAAHQARRLAERGAAAAAELATWKNKVRNAWPQVRIYREEEAPNAMQAGETMPITVAAHLDGLEASDVVVECLVGTLDENNSLQVRETFPLKPAGRNKNGETLFHLDLCTAQSGLLHYRIRIYPYHPLLSHRFELGCMVWV